MQQDFTLLIQRLKSGSITQPPISLELQAARGLETLCRENQAAVRIIEQLKRDIGNLNDELYATNRTLEATRAELLNLRGDQSAKQPIQQDPSGESNGSGN